jgi:hypothetical protein
VLLCGFVTASEEDNQLPASLSKADAITRTEVDLQFRHSAAQNSMLPRITVNESINPHLNPRARRPISGPIDPVAIDLGDQDARNPSVSYALQCLKASSALH